MSLRVHVIPNRTSPPSVLVRETWREGKRIRRRTVANLSRLPRFLIDAIDAMLQGGVVFTRLQDAVTIRRAWPHGHAAAVLGVCRKLGMRRILHRSPGRMRDLALAAIVARTVEPGSKLACARALSPDTASSSLGALLNLGPVDGNEMLALLDWLLARQPGIETSLANRHLADGTLVLYDVTSTRLEGRCCPLAAFGHSRDGRKDKMQITFGLLCSRDGCPVAVEVFPGNTGDPATVSAQVAKLRSRFGIARVAVAGDRGMLTTARIRDDLEPAGLDWISALKTSDVRKLLKRAPDGGEAPLRPSRLVPDAVAEVSSPDFPGERLMVCLNPRLRAERGRKREDLLRATERRLEGIAESVRRGRPGLRGRDRINRRLGRDLDRFKVGKHFDVEVADDGIAWRRNEGRVAAEAALDGVYAVRTSLGPDEIGADEAVEAYKCLSKVERAFRSMKTVSLEVRPVYVYTADHVRAHVFLCMLAYHVEWHLRRALAPLLFEDGDREGARAKRSSPVQEAEVSDSAGARARTRKTPDGFPVHSLKTLLADLATLTLNDVELPATPNHEFRLLSQPTPLQQRAFELLEVDPARDVAM